MSLFNIGLTLFKLALESNDIFESLFHSNYMIYSRLIRTLDLKNPKFFFACNEFWIFCFNFSYFEFFIIYTLIFIQLWSYFFSKKSRIYWAKSKLSRAKEKCYITILYGSDAVPTWPSIISTSRFR